mmetsp:Transcript_18893/g.24994  ORF Transcript_18893/g.24994 Transcript_18893/m.24994 type:complete len:225 (-) Transcript_18893:890-1564(-)
MRFCSASAASASACMMVLTADSISACPSAFVNALRAANAASRISENWTFSATFFNSGTRRGPNGATASGESTRRLMFSITTQHLRWCKAFFSFSPRLKIGQRMDSVDASTVATKVVAISSSTALSVSAGLTIAFTTAGIAGSTSGLILVLQAANSVEDAALVTWALVSQTCAVTIGMITGKSLLTFAGCFDAHWAMESSASALTRHSGEWSASKRTGQISLGTA